MFILFYYNPPVAPFGSEVIILVPEEQPLVSGKTVTGFKL
jgi:hypothetical protein